MYPYVTRWFILSNGTLLYMFEILMECLYYPMGSSHAVFYGSGGLEISNAVWGGQWTPNQGVVTKREM